MARRGANLKFEVQVKSELDKLNRQVERLTGALDKNTRHAKRAADASQRIQRGFSIMGTAAATAAGALGISSLTDSLVDLGRRGFTFLSDIEQAKVTFGVLTGSAKEADGRVRALYDYAAKTPFEFKDILTAGKDLEVLGLDVQKNIGWVGDLAAAFGKLPEEVTTSLRYIQGRRFGEALESLGRMGINRDMLEGKGLKFDRNGSYRGSVDKMMAAVEAVVRERYQGMADAQGKTFSGMVSTMRDAFNQKLGDIFKPLFDDAKNLMPEVIKSISDYDAGDIGNGLKDAMDSIREVLSDPQIKGDLRDLRDAAHEVAVAFAEMNEYSAQTGKGNVILHRALQLTEASLRAQALQMEIQRTKMALLRGDVRTLAQTYIKWMGRGADKLEALLNINVGLGNTLRSQLTAWYNGIAERLNKMIKEFNKLPGPNVSGLGYIGSGSSKVNNGKRKAGTQFIGAQGGIVYAPTRALIGEAGPEKVTPLGKDGLGNTVNVYLTVAPGMDTRAVTRAAFDGATAGVRATQLQGKMMGAK